MASLTTASDGSYRPLFAPIERRSIARLSRTRGRPLRSARTPCAARRSRPRGRARRRRPRAAARRDRRPSTSWPGVHRSSFHLGSRGDGGVAVVTRRITNRGKFELSVCAVLISFAPHLSSALERWSTITMEVDRQSRLHELHHGIVAERDARGRRVERRSHRRGEQLRRARAHRGVGRRDGRTRDRELETHMYRNRARGASVLTLSCDARVIYIRSCVTSVC